MTKKIKGDLILEKDTTFEEDLIVKGNIISKNNKKYNLIVWILILIGEILILGIVKILFVEILIIKQYTLLIGILFVEILIIIHYFLLIRILLKEEGVGK